MLAVTKTLARAGEWKVQMSELAADLVKVMQFYDSIGGVVGYQLKCLELIRDARAKEACAGETTATSTVSMLVPQGPNLQGPEGRAVAHRAACAGLQALPHLAEIYPLGGV